MPSSAGTSLFLFALVLSTVSPVAAVAVAFLALCWEGFLFFRAGVVR